MKLPPLLPHERGVRVAMVAALLGCGVLLWQWAQAVPGFAPKCVFHSVTGLPCAFCGATRSVCAAVAGEWVRALELNAAGVVVVVATVLLGVIAGAEAVRGRALVDWGSTLRRGARFLPLAGAVLVAWWGVHLLDAVRKPNAELVDFSNPVARQLAEWFGVDASGSSGEAAE